MYRMLQRNLQGYFKVYEGGDYHYRYQVAELLKGLMDKELYELWEVEAPQKYKELSELVYAIKMHTDEFPRFETLSFDLWGMGYEAIPRNEKADEHLKERLKIIHLCLGGAYLQ